VGRKRIAEQLKDSCGESLSWISRALSDRSVLGEFQPSGRDPIIGYYPQIVSQAEFDAVQEQAAKKRRGGKYVGGNRNSDKADNVLTGLVWDSEAERPMNFQKVKNASYLRTSFKAGGEHHSVRYDLVERIVLEFLSAEDWHAVAGESESEECKAARKELNDLLREIDVVERRIQKTNAAMDAEDIDVAAIAVLASRVAKFETQLATLASRKETLEDNVQSACYRCSDLRKPEVLLDLIQKNTTEANDIRLRLRTELKKRIARIDLVFYPDSAAIGMGITYVNNVRHLAVFSKEKNVVLLVEDAQGPEDSEQRVRAFLDKRAEERMAFPGTLARP
jgi:hypothetical protein